MSSASKIIERVVKSRLMDHLTSDSLLNSHQSAYCKHHSTEIALLYIHDHLVSAIGSQKVSCLWLLDLSAAFDTVDHDILITRLSSWFDIHGSVLSWFKSNLSSRCFHVKCKPTCPPGTHPPAVSPRLCPRSTTLRHVHYSAQYPHFLLFPKLSPLRRWHSALSFLPSDSLWLRYFSIIFMIIILFSLMIPDKNQSSYVYSKLNFWPKIH